jgi:lysyl-tRNA synthetase class 1
MHWADKIALGAEGAQVVNDSKTPSGRVHVGALRGVLIHDAITRALRDRNVPVTYLFGVDDYDPLDELPAGHQDFFRPWLGRPLCDVPAPPGSPASDVAEHFIGEFFDIFEELGVHTERYRMRDIYREGRFNESIDAILRHADAVRRIYREVSGSQKEADWFPFNPVCENCGRVASTIVTAYENGEVVYQCRNEALGAGESCGHSGSMSPFDGRGKLPWKLEWVAKWHELGVTIEGAGKDHTTKGGSRDVADRCLREIFGEEPPLNVPYEFFLFGGAKMSSSRGLGAAARDVADILPPEILRFLMIRSLPNRPVEFSGEREPIVKLYNEFDRYHERSHKEPEAREDEKRAYQLSLVDPENEQGYFYTASFPLLLTLLTLPHLDLDAEIEKRKGSALDEHERRDLAQRVEHARAWAERYGDESDRSAVQESLPESAASLSPAQCGFLHRLADLLDAADWDEENLQALLFDAARLTPVAAGQAFEAFYRVFLDCDQGPRGGSLLSFLGREFAVRRLREVPFSEAALWDATALDETAFDAWVVKNGAKIDAAEARLRAAGGRSALEVTATFKNGRRHLQRVALADADEATARQLVARVAGDRGFSIAWVG